MSFPCRRLNIQIIYSECCKQLTIAPCISLAGSDTTAISLRAIFYYIVQNPHVYTKLQNELDEADGKNMLSEYITYEECLKLPYL